MTRQDPVQAIVRMRCSCGTTLETLVYVAGLSEAARKAACAEAAERMSKCGRTACPGVPVPAWWRAAMGDVCQHGRVQTALKEEGAGRRARFAVEVATMIRDAAPGERAAVWMLLWRSWATRVGGAAAAFR